MKAKLVACHCQSGASYTDCCGRFIDSGELARTAEQLMRSRYTAYVDANSDYLIRTWHPSTQPQDLSFDRDVGVKWLGLKILSVNAGGEGDDTGEVEFVARYKQQGRAVRLHENSRFVRHQGAWLYVDGDIKS